MPHVIVEFSDNVSSVAGGPVDVSAMVAALHDAALATGTAALDALRTRAVPRECFAIADRHPDNMFIAVTARLGAGRPLDERQRFVAALMAALESFLGDAQRTMMLSVECQEIDPAQRINHNNVRPLVAQRSAADHPVTDTRPAT